MLMLMIWSEDWYEEVSSTTQLVRIFFPKTEHDEETSFSWDVKSPSVI
jgi:hypothetical protein